LGPAQNKWESKGSRTKGPLRDGILLAFRLELLFNIFTEGFLVYFFCCRQRQ
jgi:hypothetical protein